jgi:hypothetical protein
MNTVIASVKIMTERKDIEWLCNLESQFAERIARWENLKENINLQLLISESRRLVTNILVNESN